MKQISKAYEPQKVEKEIYKSWEEAGYFRPEIRPDGEPFCIIMPPPNANGSLHLGHAVFVTLEDLMTRFARLQGKAALWLPGADHAGFETQVVYEKKLEKEGRNRFEMPREQLYKETLDFTLKNKAVMEGQLRELGASCDWSREKFTLDPDIIKTVLKTFKRLYDDGLAYRGIRPVNWCTKHQTSLSDLEVKYEEQTDPLYYIKYGPLTLATVRPETKFGDTAVAVNPDDKRYQKYIGKEIGIETVLGPAKIKVIADEYVDPKFGTGVVKITPAHDPNDFDVAMRHNLEIKEVIDQYGRLNEKAGPYKGMKILEARAKVVEDMEKKGLIEKIDNDYVHQVGKCYKCGTIIEPRVLPQWFIAVNKKGEISGKTWTKDALNAVKKGETKFVTDKFRKIFNHWVNNLRDWNISRQIVWGIQIPAWYCQECNEVMVTAGEQPKKCTKCSSTNLRQDTDVFDTWFSSGQWPFATLKTTGKRMGFAGEVVAQVLGGKTKTYRTRDHELTVGDQVTFEDSSTGETFGMGTITNIEKSTVEKINLSDKDHGKTYERVEELITALKKHHPETEIGGSTPVWIYTYNFSKETSSDFDKFYPTDVMETGWDILPFWVMRMLMMGIYMTGQVPFKNIYLHGLVRDKDRQKMSKSKGNVIDPLGVAELYGTDAVRLALVFGVAAGNDVIISEEKIRGMRNFANKIWNASRFVILRVTDGDLKTGDIGSSKVGNWQSIFDNEGAGINKEDAKIWNEHLRIIKSVTEKIEKYRFSQAGEELYEYFWHEFCDKYIEQAKAQLDDPSKTKGTKIMLIRILAESLIMLHPFIPFVTEAVWQELRKVCDGMPKSIMIAAWPKP